MLEYKTLAEAFNDKKKKKYPHVGMKWGAGWITYDEQGDFFTYSFVYSKRYVTRNDKGQQIFHTAKVKEHDKWTMKSIARIYPGYAELFRPQDASVASSGGPVHNFFEVVFGISVKASRTIKFNGYEWYDNIVGHRLPTKVPPMTRSAGGIRVYPFANSSRAERRIEALIPVGERTFDKDNQKQLNARIKVARRVLGLRAKLGAFQALNWVKENERLSPIYPFAHYSPQIKDVNDALMAIDESDLRTMIPALWMAKMRQYGFYGRWEQISNKEDWLDVFNKFIEANREGLRKHNGAVSYVVNEQASQTDQAAADNTQTNDDPAPAG